MAAVTATPQEDGATGQLHRTAIEQIAATTGMPVESVRVIYDREIQSLTSAATITQFVGVIATRRVLLQLRRH
jgi:hypothetical protein